MFWAFLLFFIKSIQELEESPEIPRPTCIPVSVSIDSFKSNMFTHEQVESKYLAEYGGCNTNEDVDPRCGFRCWSSKSADDYLEYTFKGVLFEIYGTLASNNGNFSLLINDTEIAIVNLYKSGASIHNTKVFTSNVLEYGEHRIRIQGFQDQQFEIWRLTFWPSFQTVRVNVSELTVSRGNWASESDKAGGVRHYSSNADAVKGATFPCSKVWVYGTVDPNHGQMDVEFGDDHRLVNQEASPRIGITLLYESEKVPFKMYQVLMSHVPNTRAMSFSCIYYLNDAPAQTPAPNPSRSKDPESDNTYIDKTFINEVPNGQIQIVPGSNVKQISGCHFIDINSTFYYFIRPETEILFYDNIIEYTDIKKQYSAPIYANYNGNLLIKDCRFAYARCSKLSDANVLSANKSLNMHIVFEKCQIVDCGNSYDQFIIRIHDRQSSLQLIDCSFTFSDVTKSCQTLDLRTSNCLIDNCVFDKCGHAQIEGQSSTGVFILTNNIIQNSNRQFLTINDLQTKPVLTGNTFQNVNLESGYFISINHNQEEVELFNNTFSSISSGNGQTYGGGISFWMPRINYDKYTLTFDQCKFNDIINNNNIDNFKNGGALQYGHTLTTANVSMIFTGCEFKRNKSPNGNGGALAIDILHNVRISNCIFEGNVASQNGGSIYIWSMFVNNQNADIAEISQMDSIIISNCQFIENKGNEGQVLYTEEKGLENALLEISNCTFTNNGETYSKYVIYNQCNNMIYENNSVEFTDRSKSSGSLLLNNYHNIAINNCSFKNSLDAGCVKFNYQPEDSNIEMKKCEFLNCKSDGTHNIKLNRGNCVFDSITISFDDVNDGCGGIEFLDSSFTLSNSKITRTNSRSGSVYLYQEYNSNDVSIIGCTFDNCEGFNRRCVELILITTSVIFKNNTIKNMMASGNKKYSISFDCTNRISDFVFDEIIFIDNTCNTLYGGGSGIWVTNVDMIEFINCQFINNIELKSDSERVDQKPAPPNDKYYSGDGGAIQYGFSNSIYDVNMVFTSCLFKQNKAVRHGGALALQTVGTVKISKCIFEDNVANYKPQSSELLDYTNYYSNKTEGRGGAIYLNPAFQHQNSDPLKHMKDVEIDGCTFNLNDAYDGYAIYIEGEDPGNSINIYNNTFNDNHDDASKSMIISEIPRIIVEKNSFSNSNPDVDIPQVMIIDHEAKPLYQTPIETQTSEPSTQTQTQTSEPSTQTQNPPITSNPELPTGGDDDTDVFEVINVTSKGRHDYTIVGSIPAIVIVLISHFNNIYNSKDGGAIHIVNAGISCNYTDFVNCSSDLAGGGIYISNTLNSKNRFTLIGNNFTECKALYGGGMYVYSTNKKNYVLITECSFLHNQATAPNDGNGKYGGSSLYATIRKGKIADCIFYDQATDISALKLDYSFKTNKQKSSLSLLHNEKKMSLIITRCQFNLDNYRSSGVYFIRGKSDVFVELNDCSFKGILDTDGHYIDGETIANDSPKLMVNDCKFESGTSKAVILDSDFLSIGTNNQFINSNKSDNKNKQLKELRENSFAVVMTVASIVVVAIVGIALVTIKIKKDGNNLLEENTMPFDASFAEAENEI